MRLTVSLLEQRTVPAVVIDRGDFYRADGQQIQLLERIDQLLVRTEASRLVEDFESRTRAGGDWAGLRVVEKLGNSAAILEYAASPRAEISEAIAISDRAGIHGTAPVFESARTHGWIVATSEVVIRFKPGISAEVFFSSEPRITSYRRLTGTPDQFIATIVGNPGRSALQFAEELNSDSRLVWATPNLFIQSHRFTNDPIFPNQWHLENTGQTNGKVDADVDAPEAWSVTIGNPNIVVAIMDDAIEWSHPDLIGNAWSPSGELAGNSIDDDGNGWIDDVHGWDFWDDDNNPEPNPGSDDNHGTAVAGIAVAVGNNNLGVAGVAYGTRLMPIRSNIVPALATLDNAPAIYYAAGRTANGMGTWRGADILSCSWGYDAPFQPLSDAIAWASANGRAGKGLPTFFASGNSGDDQIGYPANLAGSLSGVMAIGGSNHNDVRAGYSQYGPELDFVTPTRSSGGSGGIRTTDRTGSEGYSSSDYTSGFSGTSASTPLAAGIGALVLSRDPNLTAAQLRGLLRNTTDLIGEVTYGIDGRHEEYGFGRLNADTAVRGVGTQKAQVLHGGAVVSNGSGVVSFMATTSTTEIITLRIRNQGTLPLNLGTPTISGNMFSVESPFTDSSLSVGEAATFSVRFAPTTGGTFNSTLSFETDDPSASTYSFQLNGDATDVTPPHVAFITNGDGTNQRSRWTSVRIVFDEPVALPGNPATPFTLTGPGGNVSFMVNHAGSITTLVFTGPGLQGGSLPDGFYTLTINGSLITDGAGFALDGDGNGTPGGVFVSPANSIYRFFGDATGDRRVDSDDFAVFRTVFGTSSLVFDFDGDNSPIGADDFSQFRIKFGQSI